MKKMPTLIASLLCIECVCLICLVATSFESNYFTLWAKPRVLDEADGRRDSTSKVEIINQGSASETLASASFSTVPSAAQGVSCYYNTHPNDIILPCDNWYYKFVCVCVG